MCRFICRKGEQTAGHKESGDQRDTKTDKSYNHSNLGKALRTAKKMPCAQQLCDPTIAYTPYECLC